MNKDQIEAYEEWRLFHQHHDRRFKPMHAEFIGGDPAVVFYAEGDEYPWSVQFRGNGHYYKFENEAYDFILSRRESSKPLDSTISVLWRLENYLYYLINGSKNKKALRQYAALADTERRKLLKREQERRQGSNG